MMKFCAAFALMGVASAGPMCHTPTSLNLPTCACDCTDGIAGTPGPAGPQGAGGSATLAGNNQPHNNMQPVSVINYIIALTGVFPSRSGRDAEVTMEPLLGNIIMFAGNFAPRGWAFCDGQLLPISQNTALFSILGTQYGGDGRTTFGLPDMRGRTVMHSATGPGLSSRRNGEKSGTETHTLTQAEMPVHNHNE